MRHIRTANYHSSSFSLHYLLYSIQQVETPVEDIRCVFRRFVMKKRSCTGFSQHAVLTNHDSLDYLVLASSCCHQCCLIMQYLHMRIPNIIQVLILENLCVVEILAANLLGCHLPFFWPHFIISNCSIFFLNCTHFPFTHLPIHQAQFICTLSKC